MIPASEGWGGRRFRPGVRLTAWRTFARMSTLQFQFLILIIAGWVNRTQQDVIEYLEAENRVLREQLGDGRLLLTDGQRRRLAVRAKAIGRLLAHYGATAMSHLRSGTA